MTNVSYGIAETDFNQWEVREFRNGFLHDVVASGLPKRDAQRIRDEHIVAADDGSTDPA